MKPRRKQKIKWSPELAYVVGLLVTDGSLSINEGCIDFTSKDIQLLKTFKKCLGIKNKIGFKTSGSSNRKYPRIQFGDIVLYNWLLGIGLTPNKTKTIGRLKIPKKYFFDFLRGHFDGDGSCYGYWDRRWKNSFVFYIYFHSASVLSIKWLRQNLKNLLGVWGSFSFTSGEWRIKYAKGESRLIFSKMYYKENLPCLRRKYKKLKALLNTDLREQDRPSSLNGRVMEPVDIYA